MACFKSLDLVRHKLCDTCQNITLQDLGSDEYRHSQGYQILLSSSEKCDFCSIMRDGIRKGFITNTKGTNTLADVEAVDVAILASVLHGNPYSPGVPGWVSLSRLRNHDRFVVTVWVSAQAWCSLEVVLPSRK
jgi:hypothetical protein